MTEDRLKEHIAADVDEKFADLTEEAQNAAAIFAEGMIAGMTIKKTA